MPLLDFILVAHDSKKLYYSIHGSMVSTVEYGTSTNVEGTSWIEIVKRKSRT